MTNSTTNVPSVRIPDSVTHEYAYAYGYLTSALAILGDSAKRTDASAEWSVERLIAEVTFHAECARLLDAEMSRRANERINKIINA
jgi:hypothetical protein